MPAGFFSTAELHKPKPPPAVAQCGKCKLFQQCLSPKMPISGKGEKKILIVGEAPGEIVGLQIRLCVVRKAMQSLLRNKWNSAARIFFVRCGNSNLRRLSSLVILPSNPSSVGCGTETPATSDDG